MKNNKLQPFDIVTLSPSGKKHVDNPCLGVFRSPIDILIGGNNISKTQEKKGIAVGMVTIVNGGEASVHWFTKSDLYNAWWEPHHLEVLGNAMKVIADEMSGPCDVNYHLSLKQI